MIYFVECGDYIKIGYTGQKIKKRVQALVSSNPYPVKLLFAAPGGVKEEQELHTQFREFHHQGEWFKKTPEFLAGIEIAKKELEQKPERFVATAEDVASSLGLNSKATKLMMEILALGSGGRT